MKDLNEYGVQEMKSNELKNTDGGIGLLGIALLCSAAYFLGREVGKLL